MDQINLDTTTAVVTGASRGFGRAVSGALVAAGARVVGVARDEGALARVHEELGDRFEPVAGDAAESRLAAHLIGTHRPWAVVLAAGAFPEPGPVHLQSWESFSHTWEVDVQQVFHWTREALLQPLDPGSTVVSFGSGASLQGSPLSGGYAGAKAMVCFLMSYAADESARAGLGVRFTSVLPRLTPETGPGLRFVAAYAERAAVDEQTFLEDFGAITQPGRLAQDVLQLLTDPTYDEVAYVVAPEGGLRSV